jgi:site-specific DNA-methyltransferase (adenine-specific)
LKDTGMLVIHCSVPFNYELIRSAPRPPNYSWYWNKKQNTCPLIANQQPLRCIEEILVWRKKKNFYNRIQIGDEERKSHWMTPTSYYGVAQSTKQTTLKGKTRNHYIEMNREIDGFSTRPKDLVKLLIETYSNPGDTVLDPTCYKGLSGVISKKLGRHWIGIDLFHYPDLLMKDTTVST